MNFKKRKETKYLYVDCKDLKGATMEEALKAARKKGDFDTGCHYLIHENGSVETDRDLDAVAGYTIKDAECSIHVLMDTGTKGTPSDAQKYILKELMGQLKSQYPDLEQKRG